MQVAIRESIEIGTENRADIFAFAGSVGAYRPGATFRQCVKDLAATIGTDFIAKFELWLQERSVEMPPIITKKRRQHRKAGGSANAEKVTA